MNSCGQLQQARPFPKKSCRVLLAGARLSAHSHAVADVLSAVVRRRAQQHGVAPALLASRDELERFASGNREESSLSSGWRYTLVGAELEDILDGAAYVSMKNGHIVVERFDHASHDEEPCDGAS